MLPMTELEWRFHRIKTAVHSYLSLDRRKREWNMIVMMRKKLNRKMWIKRPTALSFHKAVDLSSLTRVGGSCRLISCWSELFSRQPLTSRRELAPKTSSPSLLI